MQDKIDLILHYIITIGPAVLAAGTALLTFVKTVQAIRDAARKSRNDEIADDLKGVRQDNADFKAAVLQDNLELKKEVLKLSKALNKVAYTEVTHESDIKKV